MSGCSAAGKVAFACGTVLFSSAAFGQTSGTESLNPLAGITTESVSSFIEQPLFSESRRPVSRQVMPVLVAPTPAAPSVPTTANLQLLGIVQTTRGTLARIVVAGSAEAQAVRSGDVVSGWTVTEITPAAVSLKQREHVASLELFTPGAVAQTPPTFAAPANSPVSIPATMPAQTGPAAPAAGGTAPPGTVPGTAAAEAAANAPYALTFGGTPQ